MTLHKRISEFLGIKYTCMYPNKCLNRIRSFRTHSTHTKKKKNSDLMWTTQGILSTREMGWKGMVIFGGKKNKKKWKNPKTKKTKKTGKWVDALDYLKATGLGAEQWCCQKEKKGLTRAPNPSGQRQKRENERRRRQWGMSWAERCPCAVGIQRQHVWFKCIGCRCTASPYA